MCDNSDEFLFFFSKTTMKSTMNLNVGNNIGLLCVLNSIELQIYTKRIWRTRKFDWNYDVHEKILGHDSIRNAFLIDVM